MLGNSKRTYGPSIHGVRGKYQRARHAVAENVTKCWDETPATRIQVRRAGDDEALSDSTRTAGSETCTKSARTTPPSTPLHACQEKSVGAFHLLVPLFPVSTYMVIHLDDAALTEAAMVRSWRLEGVASVTHPPYGRGRTGDQEGAVRRAVSKRGFRQGPVGFQARFWQNQAHATAADSRVGRLEHAPFTALVRSGVISATNVGATGTRPSGLCGKSQSVTARTKTILAEDGPHQQLDEILQTIPSHL